MDIIEEFIEVFVGLLLLLMASVLLFDNVMDPAMEQITINYNARADKAVTFSYSFNDSNDVHDQKVGRLPGIDIADPNLFDKSDTGNSRRYFRAEQFIMLPAVDTDVSSNPGVELYSRVPSVSPTFNVPLGASTRGLIIGSDPMSKTLKYTITRDSLYDKQTVYDSLETAGLYTYLNARAVYGSPAFGSQIGNTNMPYGGFNITVESGIHPTSKKKGNTVIFVEGRVPTR